MFEVTNWIVNLAAVEVLEQLDISGEKLFYEWMQGILFRNLDLV